MPFQEDVAKFNGMYKLPVATSPSLSQLGESAIERLIAFKDVLREELDEIDEIQAKLVARANNDLYFPPDDTIEPYMPSELEILTDIADLMGDLQVYCASEMAKFGLPQDKVLEIIMESNFSKQFADGPHYDARGKVQKGPHYWKPEPKISMLLAALRTLAEQRKSAA